MKSKVQLNPFSVQQLKRDMKKERERSSLLNSEYNEKRRWNKEINMLWFNIFLEIVAVIYFRLTIYDVQNTEVY